MVDVIRNKWCEDLEDLLQCPICMVRPRPPIYQCVQGHHICADCKCQLSLCPTCSERWSSSRNRLAENLCIKLDDIKLSLIDPEGEINKLAIPNRVSVGLQTDGTIAAAAAAGAAAGPPPKKTFDDHTGAYPCRVGPCVMSMLFGPLIKHIKTDHPKQYLELPVGDGSIFQHTWPVVYEQPMTLDCVFHIPGMGTFFLKLSSDIFGNFTGFVLMLHNGFVSKQFTYQLEISCCQEHTCAAYTGEVCSCRTPAAVLKEKSLQASRTEMCRLTSHEKHLKCTVLLGKKPRTKESEQTMPNNWQKNHPRNRNNAMGRGRPFEGQSTGPRNPQSMNHRMPRPQTAPNGLAPLLRGFPPSRSHSMNRPPSLQSLLPDLRDV